MGNGAQAGAGEILTAPAAESPAATDPVVTAHRDWAVERLSHPALPQARS